MIGSLKPCYFGVVLFSSVLTDQSNENEHVACLGDGTPFSFMNINELPKNALWITNCKDNDSLVEANLKYPVTLASSDYFGTELEVLIQELSLGDQLPIKQVAILSRILSNAAYIACHRAGLLFFPKTTLAHGLAQRYSKQSLSEYGVSYQFAEHVDYTSLGDILESGSHAHTARLWFDRGSYASRLLADPLPTAIILDTELANDLNKLPCTADIVHWIEDHKLPAFCEVLLHQKENGGDRDSITVPYFFLNLLAQFYRVELLHVYIADGWQDLGQLTDMSLEAGLSYSYGLAAQSLWQCHLLEPQTNYRSSINLGSAWLRGKDTFFCLQAAVKANKHGLGILAYGNGSLTVTGRPDLIKSFADELQMQHSASYGNAPARDNLAASLLRQLISNADYASLEVADNHFLRNLMKR